MVDEGGVRWVGRSRATAGDGKREGGVRSGCSRCRCVLLSAVIGRAGAPYYCITLSRRAQTLSQGANRRTRTLAEWCALRKYQYTVITGSGECGPPPPQSSQRAFLTSSRSCVVMLDWPETVALHVVMAGAAYL
eukprot:COSAG02_NODE_15525_length_1163_cov_1.319549_1_plen_133_part_01